MPHTVASITVTYMHTTHPHTGYKLIMHAVIWSPSDTSMGVIHTATLTTLHTILHLGQMRVRWKSLLLCTCTTHILHLTIWLDQHKYATDCCCHNALTTAEGTGEWTWVVYMVTCLLHYGWVQNSVLMPLNYRRCTSWLLVVAGNVIKIFAGIWSVSSAWAECSQGSIAKSTGTALMNNCNGMWHKSMANILKHKLTAEIIVHCLCNTHSSNSPTFATWAWCNTTSTFWLHTVSTSSLMMIGHSMMLIHNWSDS